MLSKIVFTTAFKRATDRVVVKVVTLACVGLQFVTFYVLVELLRHHLLAVATL